MEQGASNPITTVDEFKYAARAKDRQSQVGGENLAYHLLKGLPRFAADLNAHSFFILGLESDSNSTRKEDYSAYESLSNQIELSCPSL